MGSDSQARDAAPRVGRYLLRHRLGAGTMGEVHLAIDEELDRPVAIKLVHAHHQASERWAQRLRTEARALARLAHPNVVHVYEVGEHEGRVYLTMEYIEGGSVRDWLRDAAPPSWEQVLAVYLDAGRGLLAAHTAGLVHRDFKPDNILRGVDGRVAVVDFGLAAIEPTPNSVDHPPETLDGAWPSPSREFMGTLAYAPPERGLGQGDARADQFALCVALYEGLWGRRPFGDADWTPEPPPREGGAPSWLWPIIRRGLARDPDQRWPDLGGLLAAIERGLSRRRRRRRLLGPGLIVITASLLAGVAPARAEPAMPAGHSSPSRSSSSRPVAMSPRSTTPRRPPRSTRRSSKLARSSMARRPLRSPRASIFWAGPSPRSSPTVARSRATPRPSGSTASTLLSSGSAWRGPCSPPARPRPQASSSRPPAR